MATHCLVDIECSRTGRLIRLHAFSDGILSEVLMAVAMLPLQYPRHLEGGHPVNKWNSAVRQARSIPAGRRAGDFVSVGSVTHLETIAGLLVSSQFDWFLPVPIDPKNGNALCDWDYSQSVRVVVDDVEHRVTIACTKSVNSDHRKELMADLRRQLRKLDTQLRSADERAGYTFVRDTISYCPEYMLAGLAKLAADTSTSKPLADALADVRGD